MSIDASPVNSLVSSARSPAGAVPLGYASAIPLAQAGDVLRAPPPPGEEGELLVARDGVTLPEKCVLCGRGAHRGPIPLRFSWDTSFRLTRRSRLQLGLRGSVRAFLCRAHRGQWVVGRVAGVAGIVVSFLLIVVGGIVAAISESSAVPRHTPLGIELMIAGFVLMNVALFYFALRTRTLSCTRIENGYLYLDGASEAFLQDLPPIPQVVRDED